MTHFAQLRILAHWKITFQASGLPRTSTMPWASNVTEIYVFFVTLQIIN